MPGGKGSSGPSGTTQSFQNTEPWKPQQPYLETGFREAERLYNSPGPQYYPDQTWVAPNVSQLDAITRLITPQDTLGGTTSASNEAVNRGDYLWANPANSVFGSLATMDSPEAVALRAYTSGERLGQNDPALQSYLSGSRVDRVNPALAPYLSGSRVDRVNPALQSYLSGERLGKGNPYTQELTDNILAKVLPGIQSQFIRGGTLSSPEAMRASAGGATSALAPLLFAQQQQEEQNQIQAADLYGVQNQRELQNQITAADLYGTQNNQQMQNQMAANDAQNRYRQQEAQNQLSATRQLAEMRMGAAGGISSSFTGGMNDMLRGLALTPGSQEAALKPTKEMLQAATMYQQMAQQGTNDAVQRWNWAQELPYQRFNQYMGGVTGNYGGSSMLNQPYFDPPGQSPLGMLGQGVGIASSLFGMFSDRRLKDNIKTVGKLDNGLKVYSYRYKDDPEEMRRIGLMADEVEEATPDAVMTAPPVFGSLAGFKMVDYARATE